MDRPWGKISIPHDPKREKNQSSKLKVGSAICRFQEQVHVHKTMKTNTRNSDRSINSYNRSIPRQD